MWESTPKSLVNEMVNKVSPVASRETRNEGEELAITALVTGYTEKLSEVKGNAFEALDVHPFRLAFAIGNALRSLKSKRQKARFEAELERLKTI
ncbi:hypothetical protein POTOM_046543 [Populus tomentosa]|uniref:Uncharacterized protein n=1 Tax=Populus tomentosa TaxID=118781 RepID=A0A8X7YIB4_POPTO|nr:hypothetical protein POTOM_046543 [Populus tomentosa]